MDFNESPYRLSFEMFLPKYPLAKFLLGKITYNSPQQNLLFQATSGIATKQYIGAWAIRGAGCLPPSNALLDGVSYSVVTSKLWLPKVKGVEGSFYKILPFGVRFKTPTGAILNRGDFGIHFDPPGTPGSAGCIVFSGAPEIKQKHWDLFRDAMAIAAKAGVKEIPLQVNYIQAK